MKTNFLVWIRLLTFLIETMFFEERKTRLIDCLNTNIKFLTNFYNIDKFFLLPRISFIAQFQEIG